MAGDVGHLAVGIAGPVLDPKEGVLLGGTETVHEESLGPFHESAGLECFLDKPASTAATPATATPAPTDPVATAAVAGFKLDVPKAGGVDTATVKLEAGTYTLYCDIPGHRQAGLEDHLTVG